MINHYSTLRVGPTATHEEVRSAYLSLARMYHPDRNAEGTERFVAVQRAYEVLREPRRRAEFDRQLREWLESEGSVCCPTCGLSHRLGKATACRSCGAKLHTAFRARREARVSDAERLSEARLDEEQTRDAAKQELRQLVKELAPEATRLVQRAVGFGIQHVIRRWAKGWE